MPKRSTVVAVDPEGDRDSEAGHHVPGSIALPNPTLRGLATHDGVAILSFSSGAISGIIIGKDTGSRHSVKIEVGRLKLGDCPTFNRLTGQSPGARVKEGCRAGNGAGY